MTNNLLHISFEGMNNFIVKKILGAGAYAKAYHLSYVGLENKEDCVVKVCVCGCFIQ